MGPRCDVACTFRATICEKFAPLISQRDFEMLTTYNAAVTDTARKILGNERQRKKLRATEDFLDLCDKRSVGKKAMKQKDQKNIGGSEKS